MRFPLLFVLSTFLWTVSVSAASSVTLLPVPSHTPSITPNITIIITPNMVSDGTWITIPPVVSDGSWILVPTTSTGAWITVGKNILPVVGGIRTPIGIRATLKCTQDGGMIEQIDSTSYCIFQQPFQMVNKWDYYRGYVKRETQLK